MCPIFTIYHSLTFTFICRLSEHALLSAVHMAHPVAGTAIAYVGALLSSVHMAPSRGWTGNSLRCGSVKACFYIYIYRYIYINVIPKHTRIRLLRCVQTATPSVPYFRSFTAPKPTRTNWPLYFYIYRYNIYIKVTSKHARIRLLRCVQIATRSVPYFRSFTDPKPTRTNWPLHFYIYRFGTGTLIILLH
jgi:hypothetical protein